MHSFGLLLNARYVVYTTQNKTRKPCCRYGTWHKLYTDNEFYPKADCKLWLFLIIGQCTTEEKYVYSKIALISSNLHNKTPVLSSFTPTIPKKNTQKAQQEVNIR